MPSYLGRVLLDSKLVVTRIDEFEERFIRMRLWESNGQRRRRKKSGERRFKETATGEAPEPHR